jgi:hypothetical protein
MRLRLSSASIAISKGNVLHVCDSVKPSVYSHHTASQHLCFHYCCILTILQGTPELQADVVARCKAAAPAHGEMWCSVSKKTENRRLDKEAILRKVVAQYFASTATNTATAPNITTLAAAAAAAGSSS